MTQPSPEHRNPEGILVLTADFETGYWALRLLLEDVGSQVKTVKLGQELLLHESAWPIHKSLLTMGTDSSFDTSLDAKYSENPDQMRSVVTKAFDKGFRHVSVAASASVESLISASQAVPDGGHIFMALPGGNEELVRIGLRSVRSANAELDDDRKISEIMCNVRDIGLVKSMGEFSVTVTGIRLLGDSPDDQPFVATPAEALAMGADYLAVGRSITGKADQAAAYKQVWENISLAR